MADRRLNDPTVTHFAFKCPSCGQPYLIMGVMIQDDQEMACSRCNAIFRYRIQGSNIEPYLVAPASGGKFGPAETEIRQ